jgi:hypothetical protein
MGVATMIVKRSSGRVLALLGSLFLLGGLAQAAVLYTATITLVSTDPTQLGRLSRNGIIADWSSQEPFPGTLNPTTSYHYEAIPVFVPNWFPFLQITIDSNNANIFASAYNTSYLPNPIAPNGGLDINYMGDAGGSGNFLPNDPRFFQVVDHTAANSPSGGTVLVVLNETTTNGGLNSPVGVLVEGFSDTNFDEVTPEPVTSTLLGAGLLVLAARYRRRGPVRQVRDSA